jgi:hypothetical protein
MSNYVSFLLDDYSIDIDEFYDDPSDLLSLEMASNNNFQVNDSLKNKKKDFPNKLMFPIL